MRLQDEGLSVDVVPFGAMLVDACVALPDGRAARPLFRTPWRGEDGEFDALTRNLGGEWPCVPFGAAGPVAGLPGDWTPTRDGGWSAQAHGFGSWNEWDLERLSPGRMRARIDYPDDTPIAALEREVRLDGASSTIHLRLSIEARADCEVAIGLHPVLDLADAAPGACRLTVGGSDAAWSFPVEVEPGAARFAPDRRGASLAAMDAPDGGTVDATRVPFEGASEDLLLLTDPGGEVTLHRPDRGYAATVFWDVAALPSCALWYSNGGRRQAPWLGRVRAIGIEPVIGAFDLGQAHSLSRDTPLARAGIPTAARLSAGRHWTTDYGIRIAPLG